MRISSCVVPDASCENTQYDIRNTIYDINMPIYNYKSKKGPSEIISGEIEAVSQEQAVSKLEAMGMVPINVIEKASAVVGHIHEVKKTASALHIGAGKIKLKDIDTFTYQLASLVKANVPVLRSLSLISQQTEKKTLKNMVGDLESQIKDGNMLSQALGKYTKVFNNLYLSMVRSGEKGGILAEVLYKLAEHREKEQDIRQKIQAAMAYPLFIIVVGIASIFVMVTFFLPKLIGLFENMKQELPISTKLLIGFSNFMSHNWYWFLIVIALAMVIFGRVKAGSKKKFLFDMVKLHMPIMKTLVRDAEISRFVRTLAMLFKSGLPIYESLGLAAGTVDNDVLKQRLISVREAIVNQGGTLSDSLKDAKVFPVFAVNMIAVGEEGGRLGESLNEIANVYEREVNQTIKVMTSLLEPLLILVVGVIIGFIVFAMLLPIFNIGGIN